MCLTEARLLEEEALVIKFDRYYLASCYCRTTCVGGGVAILVRDDLKFVEKNLSSINRADQLFEAVSVSICLDKNWMHVSCVYRTPKANDDYFLNCLETLLHHTRDLKGPIFVCGDFNYNFLNPNDKKVSDVTNLFSSYGYSQCEKRNFSRVQGNSKTLIDNVFTNSELDRVNICTADPGLSDHCSQMVSFKVRKADVHLKTIRKRIFNHDNINYFKSLLSNEVWADVYGGESIKIKFTCFLNTFSTLFNSSFPSKTVKIKNNSKSKNWITPDLIEESRLLKDIYLLNKVYNDLELRTRYNILKKRHEKNISARKKTYYDNFIMNAENKTKATWMVISQNINIRNNKKTYPITFSNNGNKINKDEVANSFNDYFIDSIKSVIPDLNKNLQYTPYHSSNSMYLSHLSTKEVFDIIVSCANKNSSGPDEIPYSLLKDIAEFIVLPLTYLINESFDIGYFPDELKIASIIPIHKKGNPEELANYRGIALLSSFSKIIEKAFCSQLTSFLTKQNLMSSRQFGFTKNKSTQDAILSFCDKILTDFDNKTKSGGIFFDLSRAFDTINHNSLLVKLEAYGIRGPALQWLESYLTERHQYVRMTLDDDIQLSNKAEITIGVPQGSVLGPILFNIFINDITISIKNSFLTLFADDTSAIIASNNIQSLSKDANTCIREMTTWCQKNGLILNSSKTNFMLFEPIGTRTDCSVLIRSGDGSIRQKTEIKFLGIWLDNRLTWESHVNYITRKLATKNFAMLQLRGSVSIKSLKTFYYASINSILMYGLISWGNCTGISKVFIAQKRILRTMLGLPYRSSCRPHFIQHNILTIHCLYIHQCLCYVKKNISQFKKCKEINKYTTRQADNLYIPPYRLNQVSRGPIITAIKIYNHLPSRFLLIVSFEQFKGQTKKFLIQNCFYSLRDYFDYVE